METTLLILAVCMMYSGVHGGSESMSCSMVNGRTICNRQTSPGNSAYSASQSSSSGMGPSYQSTYAGAGNPSQNQWDYSSQTVNGGVPGGYNNPSSGGYNNPSSGGYNNPSSGGPSGVSSYSSSFSGSPNVFAGSQAGSGGFVGGFATAGSFPFSPFSGSAYPPQDSPSPSGGGSAQSSSYAGPIPGPAPGPMPGPMDPFAFVGGFMRGAFPYGRR